MVKSEGCIGHDVKSNILIQSQQMCALTLRTASMVQLHEGSVKVCVTASVSGAQLTLSA